MHSSHRLREGKAQPQSLNLGIATLLLVLIGIAAACLSTCARSRNPQAALDHAEQTFQHGDLVRAQEEARKGYEDFHATGSDWAWRFRILEASILLWRGMTDSALPLLVSEPTPPQSGELAVQKQRLEGLANALLHRFPEAELKLAVAERLCATSKFRACPEVVRARGRLEMERGHFAQAQRFYEKTLALARTDGGRFLEAVALLNLSWCAEKQTHFDEALDWADKAQRISLAEKFADIAQAAQGNEGWAYYKLGDTEKAQRMFAEADKQAEKLGEITDRVTWLQASGYIYLDADNFDSAIKSYRQALILAQHTDKEDVINSLIALAFVSEQTNKLDDARRYADDALAKALEDENGRDMVYPWLVRARVAAQQRDTNAAESDFKKVMESSDAPDFLKWEAERSLAHLYEDENRIGDADSEYQTALSTFEKARCDLHERVDTRLPFLSNAQRIYEDYVNFLIAHGRNDDALSDADYDRATTLTEGLGRPCQPSFKPAPLHVQEIARHVGGTILFYRLGEKQSYLWVITPRTTQMFPLSVTSADVAAAVSSYRKKLEGLPGLLKASDDGSALYHMLVEPAHELLSKEALAKNDRVFIIPDGSLNSLNFETLEPQPGHYWIEDVTLSSAASLHGLSVSRPAAKRLAGKLLLIGDPVSPFPPGPGNQYQELLNAETEIRSVAQHFPAQQIFSREQAAPAAYLNGDPKQFSYIHFVAHGTGSQPSPLDSAIILSRDAASQAAGEQDDTFKLYARDIIQRPLHAELVTISACYGAGREVFSGEGLVGLSWAFLRAGAHNVVGALWDVSSDSAPQLMDTFYAEMQKGKNPSEALRAAKLSLLHSNDPALRSPFHWAPFQLYTGS
jgi:CHAT domain-containing protein